jgi:hypothetical protein
MTPNWVHLDENLLTVEVYFNFIREDRFVETVENHVQRHSGGYEDVACVFPDPSDPEPDDPPPGHVRFIALSFPDVDIDEVTFAGILRDACDTYAQRHPEDRARLDAALARFTPQATR